MKTTLTAMILASIFFVACKKSDTTPAPAKTVPTVTTSAVSNITSTSALGAGVIVDHGSDDVTKMGVSWSLLPNAYETGSPVGAGFANSGPFSCTLTPLQPNTTYYVQAYAANANGFGVGQVLSFKTAP